MRTERRRLTGLCDRCILVNGSLMWADGEVVRTIDSEETFIVRSTAASGLILWLIRLYLEWPSGGREFARRCYLSIPWKHYPVDEQYLGGGLFNKASHDSKAFWAFCF